MNRRDALRLVASVPITASIGLSASPAEPLDPLASISLKPHPRLIWPDDQMDRVRRLVRSNATARSLHEDLVRQAREILKAPPVAYKLIGPRLLDKSRTCLERVRLLGFLWRLDHKQIYLNRALEELHAAAAFPDWHPPHFLDTAEMTHAFALGYDWLFNDLSPADRNLIEKAIVAKGLDPALAAYDAKAWWSAPRNNWNLVCNGGIGLGALAVGDVEKDKSNAVLNRILTSLPPAMDLYAPDGGWIEGPGYWGYATEYAVALIAGMVSALGRDYELSRAPGFDHAGDFRLQFIGPTGLTFNFADADAEVEPAPEMLWLASRFRQPAYARQQLALAGAKGSASPLDLIWFPKSDPAGAPEPPLEAQFRGINVAFMRTAWNDPAALYLAAKGGDNSANHAHLDLGSFVFDAGGVRWAMDLGPDDYNLPGYFEQQRWTYYRLRTESHNTLLINNQNQAIDGKASLNQTDRIVEIDGSKAYPKLLTSWTRRFSLPDAKTLQISDDVRALQPVEILWGMTTPASVTLQGKEAVLTKDGRTLRAVIESPEDARFDVTSTRQPPPQDPNSGTSRLLVRLPQSTRAVEIDVTLTLM